MSRKPISILLVEDEPAHAEAIRRALENATIDFDLRVAGSLAEYSEALSEKVPQLTIIDFFLPDGKADAVLTSPPEAGAFPVIVMTSHGDEQVAVQAMRSGALDYIVKSAESFASMPKTFERVTREWQLRMERKRAQEQVRQRNEQLSALSARLESLREEERIRIAREIHDELGQRLTGLKIDLRWIENDLEDAGNEPRLNKLLDKVVGATEQVDAIIKAVQRIAKDLRPGSLDKLGLITALRSEAAQFQARSGIACQFVGPETEPVLSPEMSTAFFRIFQEALTNVARHSRATCVNITFEVRCGDYIMEVRDNGRGISEEQQSSSRSLGLLGMRERASQMGGKISFATAPGCGTVVQLRAPVSA